MKAGPLDRRVMLQRKTVVYDDYGEEIAACTVWGGVIYALQGGDAALLPDEADTAAESLLLAGFGASLRYSKLWEDDKASVVPWDVLKRKGCVE